MWMAVPIVVLILLLALNFLRMVIKRNTYNDHLNRRATPGRVDVMNKAQWPWDKR